MDDPEPTRPTVEEIMAGLIEAEADEAAGRFVDSEALVARLRKLAEAMEARGARKQSAT